MIQFMLSDEQMLISAPYSFAKALFMVRAASRQFVQQTSLQNALLQHALRKTRRKSWSL